MSEFIKHIAGFSQKRLVLLAADLQDKLEHIHRGYQESIAVIGMSCRFPGGATSPESFWHLLRDGRNGISEVSTDRWDIDTYYDPRPETPGKMHTRWGGFLEDIGKFDADFFGITPREAESLDPQQRLILEVSWETLESAGQNPAGLKGSKTGVFIGVSNNDYGRLAMSGNASSIDAYVTSGNANSMVAGRLSYVFGLQGPSLSVDTACSSSLMAVHLACQSLSLRECDLALVGGVNVILCPEVTISLSKFNMMAPDGRCKAFDADADGFVRGEGCGVVLLKRLSDALANRDNILAVIKGSAANQDGRSVGLTAPNGPSQEAVIREALEKAKVKPAEIGYIEAHGTGTALGDPIEAKAISSTLLPERHQDQPLYVGSVKTNIGHLESAAGIASFIKSILVLQHGEIAPNLHFKRLSPHIEWEGLPIAIPTERISWDPGNAERIAGISSFGFSGTNVHVVVSEAPRQADNAADDRRPTHLLTLSARSEEALKESARRFSDYLAESNGNSLANVCFAANTGRSAFSYRLAVAANSKHDIREHLQNIALGMKFDHTILGQVQSPDPPELALLFTGQGCQYAGMGRELFATQPTFRRALERCDELLRPHLERPLVKVLYPEAGQSSLLDQTAYTQPALFALEYALAELWGSWGIRPSVVMGHSVGEYVAACVAGLFSLEDGLKLIAARARLMQTLPSGGRMAAVFADEARVVRAIAPYQKSVSLACLNGPEDVVISGAGADVAAVLKELEAEGIGFTPLAVSHAFHSPLMEPMLDEFERIAAEVTYGAPRVGLVSNVSGTLARDEEMANPAYWRRHILRPVRFFASLNWLYEQGYRTFVEIGPHPVLSGMGAKFLPERECVWLPSLRREQEDWKQLLDSLGELYVRGVEVDWNGFDHDYPRRKLTLPTYPFERKRYWLPEWPRRVNQENVEQKSAGLAPGRTFRDDLFYEIRWKTKQFSGECLSSPEGKGVWLIFSDTHGTGETLAEVLHRHGNRSIQAFAGDGYRRPEEGRLYINPNRSDDIRNLFENIILPEAPFIRGIVYLWGLDSSFAEQDTTTVLETSQSFICAGVLHLIQQLVKYNWTTPPRVWLVTRGSQNVIGDSGPLSVVQAPLWGLGRVLALEHPEFWGGLVDLDPSGSQDEISMLVKLMAETEKEDLSAFRGVDRHVERLARCTHCSIPIQPLALDPHGTYLITGGLGGLGIKVARRLVERDAIHIVLVGRREPTSKTAETINQIEALGGAIDVINADVSREEDVSRILSFIRDRRPPLKGIIHAAGVINDRALLHQDWSQFSMVMAPKVKGAWNLHALTRGMDLDFFILFSSGASLFGNHGQGSYAAANAFLDALAHYRHRKGLPAVSINWGAWQEVGMAAALGESVKRLMASKGAGFITLDEGLESFEKVAQMSCMRNGHIPAQIGIMQSNWQKIYRLDPLLARMPILSEIMSEEIKESGKSAKRTFAQELLSADKPEERRSLIGKYMVEQVAKVVKLSPALVDINQPIVAIGIDSLMAVELRNQIERDLGVVIPLLKILQSPSVSELVSLLLDEFSTTAAVPTIAGPEGNQIAPAGAKDSLVAIDWEEGVL